jgi:hypothetical protein
VKTALAGSSARLLLLLGSLVPCSCGRESISGQFSRAISLIILSSFRELDKAEADLNEIGRGDREGFTDEHPVENKP